MNHERFALDPTVRPGGDREGGSSTRIHRHRVVRPIGSAAVLAKVFALAMLVTAGISTAPYPASASAPANFIRMLGSQALAVLRSGATRDQKVTYFRQMLFADFDLAAMSRFVLGPYWRLASPAEKQEFYRLFANHLIHIFGERLAQSDGGNFAVTGSRSIPEGVIVTSRIVRAHEPAIEVDWRLGIDDGLYKIEDLAIDGISVALTERSEFAEMIAREGGRLGPLLAMLREAS